MSTSENKERDKESGFVKGSDEYWNFQHELIRIGYKIINEHDSSKKAEIIKEELEKATDLVSARALASVLETDRELTEIHNLLSNVSPRRQITQPVVMQGGIIYRSSQGLHTPTMEEIVANANKPDPTELYFDTNSDHMAMIDPLAPHWTFGDNPRLVDPLNPGPKIPTNG